MAIKVAIWAYYLVTCVVLDKEDKEIIKIGVHRDSEDGFGHQVLQKRKDVINNWKRGKSYMTIKIKPNGGFEKGGKLTVQVVDGVEYLKLKESDEPGDELGELPKCRR